MIDLYWGQEKRVLPVTIAQKKIYFSFLFFFFEQRNHGNFMHLKIFFLTISDIFICISLFIDYVTVILR